jgi:hypothetical protein
LDALSAPAERTRTARLRAEKFAEIERYFASSSDPSGAAILAIEMWEDAEKQAGDTVQTRTPCDALLKEYCAIVREIVSLLDKLSRRRSNTKPRSQKAFSEAGTTQDLRNRDWG